MNVPVFKNFNEVSENLSLPVILEQIRNGRYRKQTEKKLIPVTNSDKF